MQHKTFTVNMSGLSFTIEKKVGGLVNIAFFYALITPVKKEAEKVQLD